LEGKFHSFILKHQNRGLQASEELLWCNFGSGESSQVAGIPCHSKGHLVGSLLSSTLTTLRSFWHLLIYSMHLTAHLFINFILTGSCCSISYFQCLLHGFCLMRAHDSYLNCVLDDRFVRGAHKDMNCEKWYKYSMKIWQYLLVVQAGWTLKTTEFGHALDVSWYCILAWEIRCGAVDFCLLFLQQLPHFTISKLFSHLLFMTIFPELGLLLLHCR
jgi:hypothetical protein